jgi:hypothetical protein
MWGWQGDGRQAAVDLSRAAALVRKAAISSLSIRLILCDSLILTSLSAYYVET